LDYVAAEHALEFFKCVRVKENSNGSRRHFEAFEELKSTLSSDTVQAYFDPQAISYPESTGFLVSGWSPVETLG